MHFLISVLDAQTRINFGILELYGLPYGNYDQCLSIESSDGNSPKISGQYCTMNLDAYLIRNVNDNDSDDWMEFLNSRSNTSMLRNIMGGGNTRLATPQDKEAARHKFRSKIEFTDIVVSKGFNVFGVCLPNTCLITDFETALNKCEYI